MVEVVKREVADELKNKRLKKRKGKNSKKRKQNKKEKKKIRKKSKRKVTNKRKGMNNRNIKNDRKEKEKTNQKKATGKKEKKIKAQKKSSKKKKSKRNKKKTENKKTSLKTSDKCSDQIVLHAASTKKIATIMKQVRPEQFYTLCLSAQSIVHGDVLSKKLNFSAHGSSNSANFGPDYLDP